MLDEKIFNIWSLIFFLLGHGSLGLMWYMSILLKGIPDIKSFRNKKLILFGYVWYTKDTACASVVIDDKNKETGVQEMGHIPFNVLMPLKEAEKLQFHVPFVYKEMFM